MSQEKQFTFLPEAHLKNKHAVDKRALNYVTISTKYNTLKISNAFIINHSLNGKYIKMYADPAKKAIAFRILNERNFSDMSGYRKVELTEKIYKGYTTHTANPLGVKRLIDSLDVKKNHSYAKLVIEKYNGGLLDDDYYYVILE